MKVPRPRHMHNFFLVLDSVFYTTGAFAANYLITQNLTVYFAVAIVAMLAYLAFRWRMSRDDRFRIKLFETLSDTLARSAEAYGISSMYNMQIGSEQAKRNSDTQAAIKRAGAMFLCANSGASYLSAAIARHRPYVIEKLKAGIPFRVILLDPLSSEKKLRNELNVAGEQTDAKLPLGDIIRMCNDYSHLEVRFVEHGMTCSLFFADDVLFFDPYHLALRDGRIENRLFCLQLSREEVETGESYFELFRRHFDVLWDRSVRIEKWLPANRSRIDEDLNIRELPELKRG